ncbi:hypothetical protein BH24ACT13_BH24ACT13_07050 [soil metagenome]
MNDTPRPFLIGGRYRLTEPVGRGGMGTVWAARDELLGREVAVKEVVPPPELEPGERSLLRERTLREARAAARISTPSAVTVFDVVEEDGRPWIVMEWLNAPTLADIVRDEGPISRYRAAAIGLRILDALDAAHAAGVLHRDVKPANVMVRSDGRAVLTDFGIATLDGDPTITRSGLLVGSPAYMAPERVRGERPTPASDLWSLGATLYAAVEGRAPFQRDGQLATVSALVSEEVPPPQRAGSLTPALDGLLIKDPLRRIDAAQARALLEEAAQWGGAISGVPAWADRPDTAEGHTQAFAVVGDAVVGDAVVDDAVDEAAAGPAPGVAPESAAEQDEHEWDGQEELAPALAVSPSPADATPQMATRPATRATVDGSTRAVAHSRSRAVPALLVAAVLALVGLAIGGAQLLRTGTGDGSGEGDSTTRQPAAAAPVIGATTPTPSPSVTKSKNPPRKTRSAKPTRSPVTTPSPTKSDEPPEEDEPPAAEDPPAEDPPAEDPPAEEEDDSASGGTPSGYRDYDDPTGFSVAIPAGWRVTTEGSRRYFTDPQTGRAFHVDQTNTPQADPLEDWQNQEKGVSQRLPGYELIRIDPLNYRGWEAADWEFTYDGNSGRRHVINRNVLVSSSQAYALHWNVGADEWASSQDEYAVFARTFTPAS